MAKRTSQLNGAWTHGLKKQEAVFVAEYLKDFGARRAALAAGMDPERAYDLINKNLQVRAAIQDAVMHSLGEMEVDPAWLLSELVDNHRIARMHGNLNASNAALKMLMQHVDIDAVAKQKVETTLIGDHELLERLHRGRARAAGDNDDEPDVTFL